MGSSFEIRIVFLRFIVVFLRIVVLDDVSIIFGGYGDSESINKIYKKWENLILCRLGYGYRFIVWAEIYR